jgi:hypothetical protein
MHKSLPSKIVKDSNDLTATTLKRENIKVKNNSNNGNITTEDANKANRLDLPGRVAVLDIARENRLAKEIVS